MADYEKALKRSQEILDSTPEGHLELPSRLQDAGRRYHNKYRRRGFEADLDTAIRHLQNAVGKTTKGDPYEASRLQDLGGVYRDKYLKSGAKENLNTAIQIWKEAVDRTPEDDPERKERRRNLGVAYHDMYMLNGAEEDAETFVRLFSDSLKKPNAPHHERSRDGTQEKARRHRELANGFYDRYKSTGEGSDLHTAISQYEKALPMTPEDHPHYSYLLQSLCTGCSDRYQKEGDDQDLDRALNLSQELVEKPLEGGPSQVQRITLLGTLYDMKYHRYGILADLDKAIQLYKEALNKAAHDDEQLAYRHARLGQGCSTRFERTGTRGDLEIAIHQCQEALGRTPEDHPDKSRWLHDQGKLYLKRYKRTQAGIDLDTAIQSHKEAVDRTPADHPELPARLQYLGLAYHKRYNENEEERYLDMAIHEYQEALNRTAFGHPDQARQLSILGYGFYSRYRARGTQKDLITAFQRYQKALEKTPVGHPEQTTRLQDLGIAYHSKYLDTGSEADLEMAIQRLQDGLHHLPSPPFDRLITGKSLLDLCAGTGRWQLAYEAAAATASLIPLVTSRYLENSDKQYWVAQFSDLASNAAASALQSNQPAYEAIRLLEVGRGIIISSLSDMRVDISDLQSKHPRIAEEYIHFRDQLKYSASQTQRPILPVEDILLQTNQRANADQELERTIQTIRSLPGFDRFLLAPSEKELKSAAACGPIVIINVSDYRCDALIMEESRLRTLPLPDLHASDVTMRAQKLSNADSINTELLEWLWDAVSNPILNALGFTGCPDGRWPRIWWIPTGPLARFPIHAAGYHALGSSDTVLDRVVSSYSSSLRALLRGRQSRDDVGNPPGPEKVVLIGMQELPCAPQEVKRLENLFHSLKFQVERPVPRQEKVVAALQDCKIFHFAGHGYTDSADPSKSFLSLLDGPLSVSKLFEMNLYERSPFLAYLSACSTGQVANSKLVNEGLHLIAAYQLAGFRHVIGTLWAVNDEYCVNMAAMTYESLVEKGLRDEAVSEGLHRACRSLRDQWVEENTPREAIMVGNKVVKNTQLSTEQHLRSQREARGPRDAEPWEDVPLHWIPYVHFGI